MVSMGKSFNYFKLLQAELGVGANNFCVYDVISDMKNVLLFYTKSGKFIGSKSCISYYINVTEKLCVVRESLPFKNLYILKLKNNASKYKRVYDRFLVNIYS